MHCCHMLVLLATQPVTDDAAMLAVVLHEGQILGDEALLRESIFSCISLITAACLIKLRAYGAKKRQWRILESLLLFYSDARAVAM